MTNQVKYIFICIFIIIQVTTFNDICYSQKYLKSKSGLINFTSDAPLETIKARSGKLSAVINPNNGTFAFSIKIESFQGFNSKLQREHFNDHYMESNLHKYATFNGKIIEEINFNENGTYKIRAKGGLNIHGVKQERIINATIVIQNGNINIYSNFDVSLDDHKIMIPKIAFKKLAQTIHVSLQCIL